MIKLKKNNNNSISETEIVRNITKRQNKFDQLLSMLPFGFGSSKSVVAILRLEGVIGRAGFGKSGLSLASVNQLIEKTFKLDRLQAVCLIINSPGGSPVQSELIANRIIQLSKKADVPVYSFIEDVAASGGYWLACAGEKIFASRSSIVGSIGVISSGFGFQEAIAKLGIERRVYTEGKAKSVLDPFQPAKSSDIKIIKALQKNIYEHFVDTIKLRRVGRLTQSDAILFNGEFWDGQIALDYGLIDGIDDLYSYIRKHYGDDVRVEYMENKQSWLKKKLGMTNFSEEITQNISNSFVSTIENKLISKKFDLE